MKQKFRLSLFSLILCISLLGIPNSAKASTQQVNPDQASPDCSSDPTQVGCWQMEINVDGSTNGNSGITHESSSWAAEYSHHSLALNGSLLAGFTCTPLQSQAGTANTGEKPQSKVWYYESKWWSVFPASSGVPSSGTWLWRLDGTIWMPVLNLSTSTAVKADVKPAGSPVGSVVHILLYNGSSTTMASVEYSSDTYIAWSDRPALSAISLSGSETATIDIDSTGRMWLATENDATDQIVVYYSDFPYSTWNSPITLITGVNDDDISVITAMPNNIIGVLWSNQNSKRFGFRYHKDADPAETWAADEVPASQSAYDAVGAGMADDHLNVAVASDGTLYAAVKTSYETTGYPKIAMLVRRLSGSSGAGVWDDLYSVSGSGTRGIVLLDEVAGEVSVIYTSSESDGNIIYRQTALQPIAFGTVKTIHSGTNNNVSSSRQNINGELVAIYSSGPSNPYTINGSLCTVASTLPPAIPALPDPVDGADGVTVNSNDNDAVNLQATVDDGDSNDLTVSFYGRPFCETPNFTLAALPDTQCESAETNGGLLEMFDDQTQWIVDNKTPWNIVYTTHLGDIVDDYWVQAQWDNANEALTRLETGSVAYGLSLGNNDGAPNSTTNYNNYFGESRFIGRTYYGGHYGSDNDNNYGLFSVAGMDFIVIHIEYGTDAAVRSWADDLLTNVYPTRRAIVVTHDLLANCTTLSSQGLAIYTTLQDRPNLILMLGGHQDSPECRLDLTRTDMGTVYALRSDYQTRNGGNGWMRLMEFQPAANQIQVYTYSPYLTQWETDANSEFTLPYTMGGTSCESFQLIETVPNVTSGASPSVKWYNRSFNTSYEWYVTVSDGIHAVTGPRWTFTTEDNPTAVNLVDFRATSLPHGIHLGWQSAQETDLIGFNLFRAEAFDGTQVMINPELIPAINPGEFRGNDYRYLDMTAIPSEQYSYWVEWVGSNKSDLYGPISASLAPYMTWLPLGLK